MARTSQINSGSKEGNLAREQPSNSVSSVTIVGHSMETDAGEFSPFQIPSSETLGENNSFAQLSQKIDDGDSGSEEEEEEAEELIFSLCLRLA